MFVFCAVSSPLLSIATAGSSEDGADPSSTTSSWDDGVPEEDELVELEETVLSNDEEEEAEGKIVEDVRTELVVDTVEDFGSAKTAAAAAIIMITTIITATMTLDIAAIFRFRRCMRASLQMPFIYAFRKFSF
jgi:hypothetical protein